MINTTTALVIGASGFLGSHVVKELLRQGYNVRIMVRASSDLTALDGLSYEKAIGDVADVTSLKAAMSGCDWVFYSAVDTRAWLFNSGPLYQTNVLGTINAVNAATACNVKRFILTSSLVTIGKPKHGIADENAIPSDEELFTEYMRTRFLAEKYVLDAAKEHGFPGIACCVSNTYGADDLQPTPHGNLIKQVALGRVPVYLKAKSECVGVVDAAQALILAAEKGLIGERYIVSESYISNKELFKTAERRAGVTRLLCAVPTSLVYLCTTVIGLFARLLARDALLSNNSARLMYQTWPLSNKKAIEQLGWQPRPVKQSIEEAVDSYLEQ
ncbi:dihydroflavonol-4-reductase [Sinobacterium caligoides]|uniref:Dihydroflavonol-4-reductase n=1 Tax=Sinobacterium caligoides TaxID=933926 RepID=A0A3N2DPR5_9GAMM|nr:NAD-dependent epimerase/dehydratase family protein [Sinobacterium caligoides]ROS01796.1 dihydroflavonol-4-reductase [Sinobacterium caligoides]